MSLDYEDLYPALCAQEKSAKDHLAALQRLLKNVTRETESGDLKSLSKDLSAMQDLIAHLQADMEGAQSAVTAFDAPAYFEGGDFAAQMLEICEKEGVDVKGNFPVYEMFPYRVKLDAENQDIYLDRKKIACMRPSSLVETVKKGQERLNKASFNAQTFVNELADAYDLALLKTKKQPGYDLYLSGLYKFLVPMGRSRKEYDLQSFAFDLARLYTSGIQETKNGRRFQFGPSRFSNKSIRILDKNGQEQHLSTICFYPKESF